MMRTLSPLSVKEIVSSKQRLSKEELSKYFNHDMKMLDYVLLFWQKQGMIRIVQDDCGACQGCTVLKKTMIESCFSES